MKKLLASVLAMACIAGLTATAFADDKQAESIHVDNDSKIYSEVVDVLTEFTGSKLTVAPGDTIYTRFQPVEGAWTLTSKVAGRYKVVTVMNVGDIGSDRFRDHRTQKSDRVRYP
jgi:predicted MPP superfamily phosphohydrolase